MEIRHPDHVALLVKDVERSRRFYSQVLNMVEIPRPSTFTFPGAWLQAGNFQIHLIGEAEEGRTTQVQPGYRPKELAIGYCAHVAFQIENLQTAIQHLHAHGVELVGGPRPRGDGVQQMYICDPDGYVIEFFVWEV